MPIASHATRHPLRCTSAPTVGNASHEADAHDDAEDRHRQVDLPSREPLPDHRQADHRQRALPERARVSVTQTASAGERACLDSCAHTTHAERERDGGRHHAAAPTRSISGPMPIAAADADHRRPEIQRRVARRDPAAGRRVKVP